MLENNQIEFEVYRKTISSSDNSIVIESDNGFGENEQFACDVIVDLGAAPGSWSQYIARTYPKTRIFAMDLLEISPIVGVETYQGDFTSDAALDWLNEKLGLNPDEYGHGTVDVVVSDMAPNTVGHKKTDHIRQMVLLEYAFDFALRALKVGGTFVCKSFTGGT